MTSIYNIHYLKDTNKQELNDEGNTFISAGTVDSIEIVTLPAQVCGIYGGADTLYPIVKRTRIVGNSLKKQSIKWRVFCFHFRFRNSFPHFDARFACNS